MDGGFEKIVTNFVSIVDDGLISNDELELSQLFFGGKYCIYKNHL